MDTIKSNPRERSECVVDGLPPFNVAIVRSPTIFRSSFMAIHPVPAAYARQPRSFHECTGSTDCPVGELRSVHAVSVAAEFGGGHCPRRKGRADRLAAALSSHG